MRAHVYVFSCAISRNNFFAEATSAFVTDINVAVLCVPMSRAGCSHDDVVAS